MPKLFCSLSAAAALAFPPGALAYPGGTPLFVTDVAPYCASCHSSLSTEQLRGAPEKRIQSELAGNKHIRKIEAAQPDGPYATLTPAERVALIRGIRAIDAASRVEIAAPAAVKAGELFEVTVTTTGGGGPVIGIALVDAAHRWQARPAASAGWQIVKQPRVLGADGADQTKFMSGRNPELPAGISYVNVYGIETNPAAGEFASARVIYQIRAPLQPGRYPLGAVFLYGTEKAAPHGAVKEVWGQRPLGGFTGSSGRVRFSEVIEIEVR
ncbi:MAG: hypothetical protein HRU00_13105 [Myxococcales bacterium]|nr:hypothetical protein [Myxococcales bacterium]